MTAADLAEIERVCNAASPGPWVVHVSTPAFRQNDLAVYDARGRCVSGGEEVNVTLIAFAREWLPALVAEVRALEEKCVNRGIATEHWRERAEALRKAGDVLADAADDIAGYPVASMYPDGPCLKREDSKDLKAALAAWRELNQ